MTEVVRWGQRHPKSGLPIKPVDKLMLVTLATYFNEKLGFAYPTAALLSHNCGIDRSYVFRVLRRLRDGGCIERYHRINTAGDLGRNDYEFTDAFLAACREEKQRWDERFFDSEGVVDNSPLGGVPQPPPSDQESTGGGQESTTGGVPQSPGGGPLSTLNGTLTEVPNGTSTDTNPEQESEPQRENPARGDDNTPIRLSGLKVSNASPPPDLSPRNGYCPSCFDGKGRILAVGARCPEHGVVELVQDRPRRKTVAS